MLTCTLMILMLESDLETFQWCVITPIPTVHAAIWVQHDVTVRGTPIEGTMTAEGAY